MTNPYQLCESLGRRATEELFGNYYIFNFTADEYNRVDFLATGLTLSCPTYVGEIKHYNQERSLRKFENYMIDYNKLEAIIQKANEQGRIPILICYFTDFTVVWNLNKIGLQTLYERAEWRHVNKDGQNYGAEKENSFMTYLYEKEAVWIRKTKPAS